MGTVCIHFTAADLARTHVAAEPDPFWETLLSWHVLQGEFKNQSRPEWRRSLPYGAIGLERLLRTVLMPLAPPGPYFPDFMTPIEGGAGFEAGLEALLSTPRQRVRMELDRLTPTRGSASWIAEVAEGKAATWAKVNFAMREYFRLALAPHWQVIRGQIRADFLMRSRMMTNGGIESMLGTMRPILRWDSPVLSMNGPADRDIHLQGRGLTIIPSYFNCRNPLRIWDLDLPPVLVYPANRLGGLVRNPSEARLPGAIADLLGHTRAAILTTTASGRTTSELAMELGISRATASEHATVLRNAGLIDSHREGRTILHTLSTLGQSLLATAHTHEIPLLSKALHRGAG